MILPFKVEAAHQELLPLQRVHEPHRNDAIGILIGQGAEQNTIDNAEDCSRRSNAQRKS